MSKFPVIALRGQQGVWVEEGPPHYGKDTSFPRNASKQCKVMTFSKDGSKFAYCDAHRVRVVCMETMKMIQEFAKPQSVCLEFSPRGTVLAMWEPYRILQGQQQGEPNLSLWEVSSGKLLKSFMQKKRESWCPQWSFDEFLCARNVNNEVHFFENNNFDTIVNKLHLQKVAEFKLPPMAVGSYNVAAYVPGAKAQPSFVRLFEYPNFGGPQSSLANKSFFKADRCDIHWNRPGGAVVVVTVSDTSSESYYGEQGLHYMNVKGESCLVPRSKNGPVYSVEWHPEGHEFCVVFGFMPAKAAVYNQKAEAVFDFGTGPRNSVYYNPFGNILCLSGFGNLQGNMEFWDSRTRKLITQVKAIDSTFFQWSPDGEHIITATCSPRLRVGNGYKLWNCSGQVLYESPMPNNEELWEVAFQPAPVGKYKEPQIKTGMVVKEAEPKRYVPPAMRGLPGSQGGGQCRSLGEEEAPKDLRQAATQGDSGGLSKAALRNKKKREAKKARQQEGSDAMVTPSPGAGAGHMTSGQAVGGGGGQVDPETDKKIRNLKKKLKQVEQLKEKQAAGVTLEINQLEKLKSEESLIQELLQLELG